ncbi:cyclic GMP-AMP synthase-like [Rana temporaria]|uniref:cyclic GMP-AMP synthase-like n=1 Tax=Rana temporaria TaxID=8407 RepID=UPI001AAD434A|nr:cyclic GMP-AMP synthase-like [Rana temporaria]
MCCVLYICQKEERLDTRQTTQNGQHKMATLAKRPRIESNPELCKVLRERTDNLKMKMKDISTAAEKVNEVIDKIIKSEPTRRHPLFKSMEKLSTGSYYEGVKLSRPNEFDIMLKITFECNQKIEPAPIDESGAFYTLAFKPQIPLSVAEYIDDEGNLLAQSILTDFRTLVKEVLLSSGESVSVKKRESSSPAVTLTIPNVPEAISVDLVLALEIQQWPKEASGGMKIDNWLGIKKRQEYRSMPYYMVAKKPSQDTENNNGTWRISFSNIEKDIIINHHEREKTNCQETKCCRKPCLKLMKNLLETLKVLEPQRINEFISYHAKTALLHACTKYPSDEDWKMEELDVCFNRYVEFFQECLKNYSLLNFFIPSHNLFSKDNIPNESCDNLFKALEDQKTNDYPIFSARKLHPAIAILIQWYIGELMDFIHSFRQLLKILQEHFQSQQDVI